MVWPSGAAWARCATPTVPAAAGMFSMTTGWPSLVFIRSPIMRATMSTPPAASRQIHALEAEFGVALFHRVGRQLQLTSAGEDLLRQSRRLLADADVLSEQARALKDGRKGTLKVSATPQLMTTFLASFLPRYQRH